MMRIGANRSSGDAVASCLPCRCYHRLLHSLTEKPPNGAVSLGFLADRTPPLGSTKIGKARPAMAGPFCFQNSLRPRSSSAARFASAQLSSVLAVKDIVGRPSAPTCSRRSTPSAKRHS